jgi:hypothetical protein
MLLQSIKQQIIWNAAKTGDTARLQQCLIGATTADFKFEKMAGKVSDAQYSSLGLVFVVHLRFVCCCTVRKGYFA